MLVSQSFDWTVWVWVIWFWFGLVLFIYLKSQSGNWLIKWTSYCLTEWAGNPNKRNFPCCGHCSTFTLMVGSTSRLIKKNRLILLSLIQSWISYDVLLVILHLDLLHVRLGAGEARANSIFLRLCHWELQNCISVSQNLDPMRLFKKLWSFLVMHNEKCLCTANNSKLVTVVDSQVEDTGGN